MHETSCVHCDAPDPGRFCSACGKPQTGPATGASDTVDASHAAAVNDTVDSADTADTADDTQTRISEVPRQGWQPLPTLDPPGATGEHTVLGGAAPGYGRGSYPPGGYGSVPPYVIAPAAAPPAPRRSGAPVVVALVALLIAASAGSWWALTRGDEAPAPQVTRAATAAPAPSPPTSPTAGSSSATPSTSSASPAGVTPVPPRQPQPPASGTTPDTVAAPAPDDDTPTAAQNAQAARDLEAQRALDLTAFDRSPHIIASLASKHAGTVDPQQLTPRGTTTWQNVDILEQHRQLRSRWPRVLLIRGTDIGATNDYRNDWLTIYDPGTFTSKGEATAWCSTYFVSDNDCRAGKTK